MFCYNDPNVKEVDIASLAYSKELLYEVDVIPSYMLFLSTHT